MTKLDQTNSNNSFQDDRIDIRELFNLLWGGKILIVIVTSVFYLCSMYYASNLDDYYKSKASMSVLEKSSGGNLGGLASLAGISLSGIGIKGPRYINTVRSRAFLKQLIAVDENVLPSIVAAKSYDRESKKLVFDSEIYDVANKKWPQGKPTHIEAYSAYHETVQLSYEVVNGTVELYSEHISPIFAKEFLDLIIHEADDLLRQRDLKRSSEAMDYLTSELSNTSLLDIRSSINQLMLGQIQTQMMTKLSSNYVLNIIEPPFIPVRSFKPSKSLIFLLTTLSGFALGIIWILMRHYVVINPIKSISGSLQK